MTCFPLVFHIFWNILFYSYLLLSLILHFFADVLRFDNTYSILQSKKISFTVDVVLPEIHTLNSEEQA